MHKAKQISDENNPITSAIIGAAIEVHKHLGPGLLESAYEQCLCHELSIRKLPFDCQLSMPVEYKGVKLDCGYRLDLLVSDEVIVELKAVEFINEIHKAQVLTYLRLAKKKIALIINFNVPYLRDGIIRLVQD